MTASKIVAAAASGVGGAGPDVDEVFSTFLYEGTGSTQTITNNIDLDGEGGLVWIKGRDVAHDHWLFDTARGVEKNINTNDDSAQGTGSGSLQQFNSNGFQLGYSGGTYNEINQSGKEFASWTFRKAKKFFDVVTYTGNGSFLQTINHNLGCEVGAIFIKRTDTSSNWVTAMRIGSGSYAEMYLNTTGSNLGNFSPSATSTYFNVGGNWAGDASHALNASGGNYVAYLFAHNNNDGGFGPDGDADIIKCGSYTGNGSTNGPEIDLGFEPQFVIIKRSSGTEDWLMFDNMRGMLVGGIDPDLRPNQAQVEGSFLNYLEPNATGFKLINVNNRSNASGNTYIYMAIRRGPLAEPDDATKVFAIDQPGQTSPTPPRQTSGFPVDFFFWKAHTGTQTWRLFDRLRGKVMLAPNSTEAETANTYAGFAQDQSLGIGSSSDSATDEIMYMWKRAPSYFDVVAYSGTGSARTVSHNLDAVPEMMWVKGRDSVDNWSVFHKDLTAGDHLQLNDTANAGTNSNMFTTTAPTASVFSVGSDGAVNGSGSTYISYLFATVAGVSKVGSFTHTINVDTNVDCGFSSGARFIIIKRTDSTGDWYVFDTVRGIVSGNDAGLFLNNTTAQQSANWIEPLSSGFQVRGAAWSTGDYIFYAIA